nr:MAG: hypothetical protein [Caudoviricetes sp.]
MNKQLLIRSAIIFVVVFSAVMMYNTFTKSRMEQEFHTSYSRFLRTVKNDGVFKVRMQGDTIHVIAKTGEEYVVNAPNNDPHLIDDLLAHNVDVLVLDPPKKNFLVDLFFSLLPVLLLIIVWVWMVRRQSNSGGGGFGKSNAKLFLQDENNKVLFEDVAGCENEKYELQEVIEFLKNPEKFNKLGGVVPRGVLLSGPPGCGKTMLARAVANEAGVPFYSASASEFIQMFVGVGASRIRDLFLEAKKHEKCVVFIDEIDSIGKSRNNNVNGSQESDQTINQLLTEMDGFEKNSGIIVIGATNRADLLDAALLRPGRFDREISVGLPDLNGRGEILKVHTKKVPLNESVNLINIAKRTPGFSGASLANLVNEAAIFASRENYEEVYSEHFEKSLDKILMGTERSNSLMNDDEKMLTSVHESSHAVVGFLLEEVDPIYKVSIIPRGRALGVTIFVPDKDTVSVSKKKLESQISSLYAGRIGEEMFLGKEYVTTGASNDIERATEIATKMVTEWGMSSKLIPMVYVERDGFIGTHKLKYGYEDLNKLVEKEIETILNRCYKNAQKILKQNWSKVEKMSKMLMEHETIEFWQIKSIFEENI